MIRNFIVCFVLCVLLAFNSNAEAGYWQLTLDYDTSETSSGEDNEDVYIYMDSETSCTGSLSAEAQIVVDTDDSVGGSAEVSSWCTYTYTWIPNDPNDKPNGIKFEWEIQYASSSDAWSEGQVDDSAPYSQAYCNGGAVAACTVSIQGGCNAYAGGSVTAGELGNADASGVGVHSWACDTGDIKEMIEDEYACDGFAEYTENDYFSKRWYGPDVTEVSITFSASAEVDGGTICTMGGEALTYSDAFASFSYIFEVTTY